MPNTDDDQRQIDDHPGVIAKPPIIYGTGLIVGIALNAVIQAHLGFPGGPDLWRWIGIALVAGAFALAGWAIVTFQRAGTNVQPHLPATKIVSTGPYGFSRNPMYVSLTALYVGVGLATDNPWILLGLIAILPVMSIGVVRREERYLAAKFGEAYTDYCNRVRRWI